MSELPPEPTTPAPETAPTAPKPKRKRKTSNPMAKRHLSKALLVFADFLTRAWLTLPQIRRLPTELQYDAATFMQYGPQRQLVMAFRGFGKSWITGAFGNWRLACDCERRFLQIGSSAIKSDESTTFMLDLLRLMPETQHLTPGKQQRKSRIQFDVAGASPSHSPSVRSLGIHSNALQGPRATDIVADDVETLKNSSTMMQREQMSTAIRELGGAILRSEKEVFDPRIIFLGTPQHEMSIYWNDLPKRGYSVRIYPVRYPTEEQMPYYKDWIAPILRERWEANPDLRRPRGLHSAGGAPTEPERFDEKIIQEREREYGRIQFLRQFMLLPGMTGELLFPLRLRDLIVTPLDSEVVPEKLVWSGMEEYVIDGLPCMGLEGDRFTRPSEMLGKHVPFDKKILFLDPAGRGEDEFAYVVLGYATGTLFLMDVWGGLGGYSTVNMEKLAKCAQRWRVHEVVVEANLGVGMMSKLLEPVLNAVHNCPITDWRAIGMKEQRIVQTLEPLISSHRLVVNSEVVERDYDQVNRRHGDDAPSYSLFWQMARMMPERDCLSHDDRLDALAGACAHFAEKMGVNTDEIIRQREFEALEKDLLEMYSFAGDGASRPRTWLSPLLP